MLTIRGKKLLARFADDTAGQIAVLFAVLLVPVSIATGAAVDYSRASGVRAALQGALDAAVLAGLRDSTATRDQTAANTFQGNFNPKVQATAQPTFVLNQNGTYSGTATASVPTAILGVVHIPSITVTAQSIAAIGATQQNAGQALCIISLNATAQKAVALSGSAQINAPKCIVQVNSNHSTDAVDMSGSTMIKVGSCLHTNYSAAAGETLQPGVYCDGLTISSKTVSFAPGLYIIKDGDLNASGNSRLTGTGVSFFLTGTGAGVTTSGGSTYHLVAMSTGPLAGFVFYLDPSSTPTSKSVLSGGSEIYFEGVLYFGKQFLELSGGSAGYTSAPFTAYIADKYLLSGSSALNINSDPSKTSVPIPSALYAGSSGGNVRLVN